MHWRQRTWCCSPDMYRFAGIEGVSICSLWKSSSQCNRSRTCCNINGLPKASLITLLLPPDDKCCTHYSGKELPQFYPVQVVHPWCNKTWPWYNAATGRRFRCNCAVMQATEAPITLRAVDWPGFPIHWNVCWEAWNAVYCICWGQWQGNAVCVEWMQETEEAWDKRLPFRWHGTSDGRREVWNNAIPLDVVLRSDCGSLQVAGQEDAKVECGDLQWKWARRL